MGVVLPRFVSEFFAFMRLLLLVDEGFRLGTGIRMVLQLLLEDRSNRLDEMQKIMVTSANDDCERLLTTLQNVTLLHAVPSQTLRRLPQECEVPPE